MPNGQAKIKRQEGFEIHPAHAWCRGLAGHRWRPPNNLIMDKGGHIRIVLKCDGCDAVRNDAVDPKTGFVEHRQYDYPDGYLAKGQGRTKPGEMRKMALTSLLDHKKIVVKPALVEKERK